MTSQLNITVGQYSDKGRKAVNQDFHGAYIPTASLRQSKGCAVALADGISSSDVSQAASEAAVAGFFEDYFSTSEAWSVKKSAHRVFMAINSWLYAQTRQSRYRYEKDRGYVCTLSAVVIKSNTAHIFHVGDARVYRLSGRSMEQITRDHRVLVTEGESYLGAALGADEHVDIEYHTLPIEQGDVLALATDGVYEYADARFMAETIEAHRDDPDTAAKAIVEQAYARGSVDNLTAQVIRVDDLPVRAADELFQQLTELSFPPELKPRMRFEGYTIIREIHASNRSHVYLAVDEETDTRVAIKTLSTELREDPGHLERFLTEEWVARRLNSPYVAKAFRPARRRHYLYTVTEYIEGQSLRQWMIDHPTPDLPSVRELIEQIARGLRAFHRMEMIHQDLRPDNVMIDKTGTVKLIDFGSTRVAGLAEAMTGEEHGNRLGTAQYSAPEYFIGEPGSERSDIFSLAVIAYQMLTGRLPYGTKVAKTRSRLDQLRLKYTSVLNFNRQAPAWIDGPLKKGLHPDPNKRYPVLSEFIFDLRRPKREFLNAPRPPLMERNPVRFWQSIAFILALIVLILAGLLIQ